MSDSETFTFQLYHYDPSIIGAAIFCALFGLVAVGHLYFVFKLHARYFIPFVIGAIFECVGYAGRAWSHTDPTLLPAYVMQSLLILVAPALIAASIYMVLGRTIRRLQAEHLSIIRPKWLTKIFVTGDVFSFFVQASGAGLQAKGDIDSYNLGRTIVIAGLIIQIVIFGFFVIVASLFHIRVNKRPTLVSTDSSLKWQRLMHVLYFASALILIRNAIRVVEYAEGHEGFIIRHEYMLYIFDALFIFAVTAVLLVFHPNHVIGTGSKSNDQTREAHDLETVQHHHTTATKDGDA